MALSTSYSTIEVGRRTGRILACPICGRPAPAGAGPGWLAEVRVRSRAIQRWEEEGGRPLDRCACDSLR